MWFEWHDIPQPFISQSGFSFDSASFFSFTVHCYDFMVILKTSPHTNAGQSPRLTHIV